MSAQQTISSLDARIYLLEEQNRELLEALKLVASLPGFEPSEEYGQTVLAAIAKSTNA